MPNRLKQSVAELQQALRCRLAEPTNRLGALLLAGLLVAGVSGSFADDAASGSDRRWVVGARVNLRAQPAPDAEVLTRLALNSEVELLATAPAGGYCEVVLRSGGPVEARGFTACRYLGTAPVAVDRIARPYLDDGKANPDYNPRQAFWLKPGYEALRAYGDYLETTRLSDAQRFDSSVPRPADAEFERMKAHLAKGIYGPPAAPYPAWDELQRTAAAWDDERRQIVGGKLRKYGTDPAQELQEVTNRYVQLRAALGLYALDEGQALALVRHIELPPAQASLFRAMDELGAPGESAEQLSGRFHIVHTIGTRGRDPGRGEEGVWDVGSVGKALTRPVQKNTLFRDGRLSAAATHLKSSAVEWSSVDEPMCEGYEDGFAYGDSDPQIWIGYGLGEEAYRHSLARKPKHSLLHFYTRSALPAAKAVASSTQQALDRDATGFIAATTFHYDLDGDGVADLAVWEGTGQGDGHLDGPPQTDDAHQRLFFANIAGRWHVLGQDRFGYGCGC